MLKQVRVKSGGFLVRMNDLTRAYYIMEQVLNDPTKSTRSFLMKYLDNIPLPIQLAHYHHCTDYWVERIAEDTVRKLELLLGPHGYTIIKVFLVKLNQEASTGNA